MLNEQRRKQLDGIVLQMAEQNAPQEDVEFVVNDFIGKYKNDQGQTKIEGVKGVAGGAVGVGKSIGGLAVGMSKLGQGLYDQTVGRIIPRQEKESTDALLNKAEDAMSAKGTAETVGKTIGDIGQFFIPGTAGLKAPKTFGLLSKAGLIGAETAGITALQEGELGKEAAVAGITGGAFSGGTDLVGKVLKGIPQRLVQSAIKQKPKEIQAGKDLTDYVLKKKLPSSAQGLLDDSVKIMDDLNNKIGQNLSSVKITEKGGKISPNNIIKDVVNKINNEGGAVDENEVRAIIEGLAPQVKGILKKPTLSVINANSLRSKIDRTLGDRAFFAQQNTFNKDVLMNFANTLREQVKQKAPKGTRKLFEDLSSEIRLTNALSDKISKGGKNQIFSLGDLVAGGAGLGIGGPGGAIVGAGIKRVVESTPAKLIGAKTINAINKAEPIIQKLTPIEQGIISELIQAIFNDKK